MMNVTSSTSLIAAEMLQQIGRQEVARAATAAAGDLDQVAEIGSGLETEDRAQAPFGFVVAGRHQRATDFGLSFGRRPRASVTRGVLIPKRRAISAGAAPGFAAA
jgi:hypothetical protein